MVWSAPVFYRGSAPDSWDEAEFVVGTAYRVSALLTDAGTSAVLDPSAIEQRLRTVDGPDGGGLDGLGEVSEAGIERVRMVPARAGTLYLEAEYQGDVIDVAPLTVVSGRIEVDDGVVYGVDDGRW